MLFGSKVKSMMDERGMSQKELCEATGMTKGHVSDIVHSRNKSPNLTTICKIADALEVSVGELLEDVTVDA